jgi:hypothetical protein
MRLFPRAIKHPFNVPVQRPHDADPRKHRWSAMFGNQKQHLHSGLPFFGIVLRLG